MNTLSSSSNSSGVVLIGMPGAGKSTIGILLAKELGLGFADTDVAIQVREGKTLQDILDESDYLQLRHIEEQVLLDTDASHKVIATGGSAVYSAKGMAKLKSAATLVYLEVPLEVLKQRIHNYDTRGIARRPEQSFKELWQERSALYQQYADIRINCGDRQASEIVAAIIKDLSRAS